MEEEEEHDGGDSLSRWADLHISILDLILRHLPLQDQFRFGSVCRPWREALRHHQECNGSPAPQLPWLFFFSLFPQSPTKPQIFYSLSEERTYGIDLVAPSATGGSLLCAKGSSHGWLLMAGFPGDMTTLFLWNPITGARILLPHHKDESFDLLLGVTIALSSSPTDPNCVVLLQNFSAFMLCRLGDQEPRWTTPTRFHPERYPTAAFSDGRFYSLTFNMDLTVLDPVDLENQRIGMVISRLPVSIRFLYLVESMGELFLVVVSDLCCAVFRADVCGMEWVRVESLGGRTFFVGNWGSASISTSAIGQNGDRVYHSRYPCRIVSEEELEGEWCWGEFDIPNGTSVLHKPPAGLGHSKLYQMFWIMPSRR